ncbi:hypothetical protein [Mesorhizobium sp. B2-3-5]|uniref:hypothetical protein n=1 Tax=Mesorhizobium sp. B2-3-5 TaxID=2589958 RepID=UPI00112A8DDE|nr:hypothetical protein [Mesorhizobium sp. B2-3-5]TPM21613.1 hypothetical protein FJ958_25870 [Mesorhizobium sp. B2-3-5]
MDKKDDLERLHQHAESLNKSIADIDHDIERATHDLAAGGDPGQLISFLQDRHNTQLGYMYDLGKAEARIEDLENLIREEQEQPQEQRLTDQLEEASPVARDEHLDWFKQSLSENPPQVDDLERAEQRMLHDLEREPVADDHLDWFPRRS